MEARALHHLDEHQSYEDTFDDRGPEPLGLAPEPVEIRRNGGLAALIGVVASAVGIAYLARATSTGAWLDWLLFAVMGGLGVSYLLAFVDARTPLLVADTQGVRIRLGRTWRGMPWGALSHVEHRPRRGPLRDGRLALVARNPERVLEELDRGGRRQSRIAQRLYGSPFAVPLALSTRVTGAGDDLTGALARLAGDPELVVEVLPEPVAEEVDEALAEVADHDEPEDAYDASAAVLPVEVEETEDEDVDGPASARRWPDPRPGLARGIGLVAARLSRGRDAEPDVQDDPSDATPTEEVAADERPAARSAEPDQVASATPSPLRDPVVAVRAEFRSDLTVGAAALAPADDDVDSVRGLPEARELRRPGSVNLVEDTLVWGDRVRPIAREGAAVEPLVIDDFTVEPAEDPVVGPELAAARTRLGLTVDQLAERTRIRPHVIESIEVDDFAPCGGDFYARGHLRTLARVLGVDVAPLLTSYDERYADAPINPRRVFEAELATGAGGAIRGTRGGPNWSVLIAAVMTLVLAWSIARLVMDSPVELSPPAPRLNGSAGPNNSNLQLGDPVAVVLTARGGAHVVVRDGAGNLAWSGDLAYGETRTLKSVAPPVRVQSSDGSLQVKVDGDDRGALGSDGEPAQNTFPVR
ncbi:helix-turn-helix domain-containing protein [Nocardioides sp. MAHUQ-72]|uniref:helix-turn-helix domain-containing protein n=1 Tax=unclassified Nocardioides TaxID=2615069 RepID=UPI003620F938